MSSFRQIVLMQVTILDWIATRSRSFRMAGSPTIGTGTRPHRGAGRAGSAGPPPAEGRAGREPVLVVHFNTQRMGKTGLAPVGERRGEETFGPALGRGRETRAQQSPYGLGGVAGRIG
jgi:hypothetical protein